FGHGLHVVAVRADAPGLSLAATTSVEVVLAEDGPGDDAPVAFPQAVSVVRDGAVVVTLRGVDPEGAPLDFDLVDRPAHGTATFEDVGVVRYRPAAGWVGEDRFTFRAFDGTSWSEPATVTVRVQPSPTSLVLTAPASAVVGSTVELAADLFDAAGSPLPGAEVTFRF